MTVGQFHFLCAELVIVFPSTDNKKIQITQPQKTEVLILV